MKLGLVAFLFFGCFRCFSLSQNEEIRELCLQAQQLEGEISKIEAKKRAMDKQEKMSIPAVRNIYEILSRYCTILANIQRFSDLLILGRHESKSDFIRCSLIIKSFSDYFKAVGRRLERESQELVKLQQQKITALEEFETIKEEYQHVCEKIREEAKKLSESRKENVIQNDVVLHIASKSESIEELDAELEAENTVGVLKNTKISTDLKLSYPVNGKIVAEFGDRGDDDEMICYLGFETNKGAIVSSPAKGLVVFAGSFLNYQNMVIISNGEYRIFVYGINELFAATGDVVDIGDYIGKMAEDSEVSPVLKMELRKSGEPLDPRHWILKAIEGKEKESAKK